MAKLAKQIDTTATTGGGYFVRDNQGMVERTQSRGHREAAFFHPYVHALERGARLVDLGCGPGTITVHLAHLLQTDSKGVHVIAVDIDTKTLDQARETARAAGLRNITFRQGDIHDLSGVISDATADAVYMNGVLMYSPEPLRALHEIKRILKPGGVVGIRDLEPHVGIWYPDSKDRDRSAELWEQTVAFTGGTPGISIQLPALASKAELEVVEVFGENIRYVGDALHTMANQIAGLIPGGVGDLWVKEGWATREEVDTMENAWRSLAHEDGAVFSHLWGGIVARNPD